MKQAISQAWISLLDLVMTDAGNRFRKWEQFSTGLSDHLMQYSVWWSKSETPRCVSRKIRDYSQLNRDALLSDEKLSSWDEFDRALGASDVSEAAQVLTKSVTEALDSHIPWKSVQYRPKSHPWVTV